jgi:phosphoribosyl 1,2-cyclic phosphodiesterase
MGLFSREVFVVVLSSGSAGNATWIGDRHAGVLIDCGVSTKQILARLAATGLGELPIDAVLVTHEHKDHVGAAGVLSRHFAKRRPVPFFMTRGTAAAVDERVRPDGIETIDAGTPFKVKHLTIEPMPIPHDTADPVAYRVVVGDVVTAVVTDLGKPTQLVARQLRDCEIAVLEFNHDEDMLMEGPYPYPLKQRIRGSHGHLSNRQAAELLKNGFGPKLRHLVLAHLSEENNTPGRALVAAQDTLRGLDATGQVKVHVGLQHEALAPIGTTAGVW